MHNHIRADKRRWRVVGNGYVINGVTYDQYGNRSANNATIYAANGEVYYMPGAQPQATAPKAAQPSKNSGSQASSGAKSTADVGKSTTDQSRALIKALDEPPVLPSNVKAQEEPWANVYVAWQNTQPQTRIPILKLEQSPQYGAEFFLHLAFLYTKKGVDISRLSINELDALYEDVHMGQIEMLIAGIGAAGAVAANVAKTAGTVVKTAAKTVGGSGNSLKFGANDLVYGSSAGGKLVDLQKSAGGKLLSDVGNPYDAGYGSDWLKFSTDTIKNTINSGNKVHFDLTYMDDIAGALKNTGKYANTVTSGELRFIQSNWSKFSNSVKFYKNGEEVAAPWLK